MVSRPREPLRLSIRGAEEAVDLAPADVPEALGSHDVRALPRDADDRRTGRRRFEVTIDGWVFEISAEPAARAALRERASAASDRAGPSGIQVVKAQIPGRVVRLWVAEGDTVEAGQPLLAIEAMKMENEVRATRAGTVGALRVAVAASVELGDELLTIA